MPDRDALPRPVREVKAKSARLEAVLVDAAHVGKVVDKASSETGIRVAVVKQSDGAQGTVDYVDVRRQSDGQVLFVHVVVGPE